MCVSDEVVSLCQRLGVDCTDEKFDTLIDKIDPNNSNAVSALVATPGHCAWWSASFSESEVLQNSCTVVFFSQQKKSDRKSLTTCLVLHLCLDELNLVCSVRAPD